MHMALTCAIFVQPDKAPPEVVQYELLLRIEDHLRTRDKVFSTISGGVVVSWFMRRARSARG